MKKIALTIVKTNAIAALVVFGLSLLGLELNHISDYLFFMVIVMWFAAVLLIGGKSKEFGSSKAAHEAKGMVSNHDFSNQADRYLNNSLIVFIASLPALLGCFIL